MKMEATKTKINAKVASALIERHEQLVKERGLETLNRQINDSLVAKYAKDMADGKWDLNGETIKIAASGRILDGQHRLWAAANHDVSFETLMVYGLDEEAFYTIDIGRGKKPSDFLTGDNVKYGAIVAAAARIVIGYRKKKLQDNHMIPTHEIVGFAKSNERLQESAGKIKGVKVVSPAVACSWHFLFCEIEEKAADKFIDDLRDGIGLTKGDPVLALRERLIKNKMSKSKMSSRDIFIIGLRTWQARRSGKNRKIVKITGAVSEAGLPALC